MPRRPCSPPRGPAASRVRRGLHPRGTRAKTPPIMNASDDAVRVRRGRRSDVARARALLPAVDPRRERFDRRTFASLAGDVYVAETADGAIVGIVSVAY